MPRTCNRFEWNGSATETAPGIKNAGPKSIRHPISTYTKKKELLQNTLIEIIKDTVDISYSYRLQTIKINRFAKYFF
jgi:hypothetical protein